MTTAQPFAIVEADFADGTYKFALTWDLASEWEKTTDRSMYATLLHAVRTGIVNLNDAREILRLGLIGGGMEPVAALRLVRTYVENRPAAENFPLVVRVMDAAFHGKGVADPDEGKPAESAGAVDG